MPKCSNNFKDIFISYRREDGSLFAQLLAEHLTQMGFSVFFDRTELHIGSSFPTELETAVLNSADFILVSSPSYFFENKAGNIRINNSDDWVRKELALALQNNKNILPIAIDSNFPNAKTDLPTDIADIVTRNYIEYKTENSFEYIIEKIIPFLSPRTINNSQKNKLLDALVAIGSENTKDYNIKIRNLVIECTEQTLNEFILPIIDSDEDLQIRFSAYYASYTFYRRMAYYSKVKHIVETYKSEFDTFKFSSVILTQYYRFCYESDGKHDDIVKSLHYAKKAIEHLPNNSGVLLSFAELVVIALDNNEKIDKKDIYMAIETIKKAMELNIDYPKQYCVYGRLEAYLGNYKEAIININRAIDLEDSEKKDAFIRIVQYYSYITDIKLQQLKCESHKKNILIYSIIFVIAIVSFILNIIL